MKASRNEWDSLSNHVERYDRKANALESLTNNLIKKKISSDLKAQIREKQQKAKEIDNKYATSSKFLESSIWRPPSSCRTVYLLIRTTSPTPKKYSTTEEPSRTTMIDK